jgi:hypothetical protein
MLSDYVNPGERLVACPNQDVVYGGGPLALDLSPVVIQVPDFGDRFWVYALYDQRTDQFAQIGKQYGTEPGFYLVVGQDWKGKAPEGIAGVITLATALGVIVPRVFMDDIAEDRAAGGLDEAVALHHDVPHGVAQASPLGELGMVARAQDVTLARGAGDEHVGLLVHKERPGEQPTTGRLAGGQRHNRRALARGEALRRREVHGLSDAGGGPLAARPRRPPDMAAAH